MIYKLNNDTIEKKLKTSTIPQIIKTLVDSVFKKNMIYIYYIEFQIFESLLTFAKKKKKKTEKKKNKKTSNFKVVL